jgi:hypothetical protein
VTARNSQHGRIVADSSHDICSAASFPADPGDQRFFTEGHGAATIDDPADPAQIRAS